MKHLRYEFKTRAEMLEVLSDHYITDEDGNKFFKDGDLVESGFKTSYNEETELSTIISDYIVDVLWNLEEPPIYKEEVTPKTPDHRFGGW